MSRKALAYLIPAPASGLPPANAYVAEDGTTYYVAEDGVTYYVQSTSLAAAQFLVRAPGLDLTHQLAYIGLLDGLTTDGLFNDDGTSSYFDCLYILATANSTTAVKNLVSSSFPITVVSTPIFTADQGYSVFNGVKYLDTTFNPTTAGGHYQQNSACFGFWAYDTPDAGTVSMQIGTGQNIYPNFSPNDCYFRVNDNVEAGSFSLTGALGLFSGNRSSSSARQGYKNGSSIGTYPSNTSGNFNSGTFKFNGAYNNTISAMHVAGSLDATQQSNFYSRMRTYMTAVGVP